MSEIPEILEGLSSVIIYPSASVPERRLWLAVIETVVKDLELLKAGRTFLKLDDDVIPVMTEAEVLDWIDSDDFRFICKAVGCRPVVAAQFMRNSIERG